jgi:hypothetical protein
MNEMHVENQGATPFWKNLSHGMSDLLNKAKEVQIPALIGEYNKELNHEKKLSILDKLLKLGVSKQDDRLRG